MHAVGAAAARGARRQAAGVVSISLWLAETPSPRQVTRIAGRRRSWRDLPGRRFSWNVVANAGEKTNLQEPVVQPPPPRNQLESML